jgi:heme A synthase
MSQKPPTPLSTAAAYSRRFLIGLSGALALFLLVVVLDTFRRFPQPVVYLLLMDMHFQLSRLGLAAAGVMALVGVYIGIIRKGDVTPVFRSATYVVFGTMLLQALIGLIMYILGGRPREEVHLIYGMATVLALPFFMFVEMTARKRPAMGSYIWGFTLLAGVIIRSISTGQ